MKIVYLTLSFGTFRLDCCECISSKRTLRYSQEAFGLRAMRSGLIIPDAVNRFPFDWSRFRFVCSRAVKVFERSPELLPFLGAGFGLTNGKKSQS